MVKKIIAVLLLSLSLSAGQGQMAKVKGIEIWYETFGEKEDPALLLIMGGCCQGVIWDEALCKRLAREGFYVIRYDHRDTGLSTCFDFDANPYGLMDMANDAVGVLEAAGVQKAHLFGVSLGGILSELIAGYYPEKVLSMTILGSSCEIRPMNLAFAGLDAEEGAVFSPPTLQYLEWMKEFLKLSVQSDEDKLAQRIEGWNRLNGQIVPLDEEVNRQIHTEFLKRLRYPQGIVNHVRMLNCARSEELIRKAPSQVHVPTVVLHGTEDPIYPPDHGEALSRAIHGSEFFLLEGMGHIPNDKFYDFYIDTLKRQASKVRTDLSIGADK